MVKTERRVWWALLELPAYPEMMANPDRVECRGNEEILVDQVLPAMLAIRDWQVNPEVLDPWDQLGPLVRREKEEKLVVRDQRDP